MDKKNRYALQQIMHNLKQGRKYGKFSYWDYYKNQPLRFPYFNTCMIYDPIYKLIRWTNYGSSADKATLKDLEWIITAIFKTTPIQFLHDYIVDCSLYIDW